MAEKWIEVATHEGPRKVQVYRQRGSLAITPQLATLFELMEPGYRAVYVITHVPTGRNVIGPFALPLKKAERLLRRLASDKLLAPAWKVRGPTRYSARVAMWIARMEMHIEAVLARKKRS